MKLRRPTTTVFAGLIDDLVEASDDAAPRRSAVPPVFIPDVPDTGRGQDINSGEPSQRSPVYGALSSAADPTTDPKAIARELGLRAGLTAADIREIRRWFALKNHPDRLPQQVGGLAAERMTIANALLDDALRSTRKA